MSEKQYVAMLQFFCKTTFRKDTILRFCKRTPWLLMGIYICFILYLFITTDIRIILFTVVPIVNLLIVTVLRFVLDRPRPFEVYRIVPLTKHSKGKSCPSHRAEAGGLSSGCLSVKSRCSVQEAGLEPLEFN